MSERAVTARVVPDLTGLDKQFDYVVPPELVPHVRVGSIVKSFTDGENVRVSSVV